MAGLLRAAEPGQQRSYARGWIMSLTPTGRTVARDAGRVVRQGPHATLLAAGGLHAGLHAGLHGAVPQLSAGAENSGN